MKLSSIWFSPYIENIIIMQEIANMKLLFVGDLGVGKTSIINWFINNTFDDKYNMTVAVDFFSLKIRIGSKNVNV